ncbi:MAG: hypothetical protein R3C39_08230 [Dehalococcoidia bacterium]
MARFASPLLALVAMAVLAFLGASSTSAQGLSRTTVSAAGYPEGVRFIEADERAFLDPVGAGVSDAGEPTRLDVPPSGFVPRIEVRSALWARLAEDGGLPAVEDVADYDNQTTLARLRHIDGTTSWWAIDEARASMLTRYARIGRGGRVGSEPTTLQVLREMRRWRESVVIDVEGFEIEPRRWDQRLLWNEFEQAIAVDATPADVLPPGPQAMSAAFFVTSSDEEPTVLDVPLSDLVGEDGTRVTFRLLDGRALPFVYLPGPSLLVDVTRLETDADARALTLPAFEVSPSVAVTVERIVATEGAPLADGANERLAEGVEELAPVVSPASAVAAPAPTAVAPAPAPRAVRSFNEAVRIVVTTVDSEASTFAGLLLALVASAVLGGAVARRGDRAG